MITYGTREQTSKCCFPFSETFSSQVLASFVHTPSHVVRVLQLVHWRSLLWRFEDEVRTRICLERSFSVLHVDPTKKQKTKTKRFFGLCRRVEPHRVTAGNNSLVDCNSWPRSSAHKSARRWKIPGFRFYTGCASRQTDTWRWFPVRVFQNKGSCYFTLLSTTSTVYMTKTVLITSSSQNVV